MKIYNNNIGIYFRNMSTNTNNSYFSMNNPMITQQPEPQPEPQPNTNQTPSTNKYGYSEGKGLLSFTEQNIKRRQNNKNSGKTNSEIALNAAKKRENVMNNSNNNNSAPSGIRTGYCADASQVAIYLGNEMHCVPRELASKILKLLQKVWKFIDDNPNTTGLIERVSNAVNDTIKQHGNDQNMNLKSIPVAEAEVSSAPVAEAEVISNQKTLEPLEPSAPVEPIQGGSHSKQCNMLKCNNPNHIHLPTMNFRKNSSHLVDEIMYSTIIKNMNYTKSQKNEVKNLVRQFINNKK